MMMTMANKNNGHGHLLLLFFTLLVVAVWGNDGGGEQKQKRQVCDCDDLNFKHDKCIEDWRALDVARAALEEQVHRTERESQEKCQVQLEQVRNELVPQIEQARQEAVESVRDENVRQLELVRQESQTSLAAAQNESVKQKEAAQQARDELSQCQAASSQLNAKVEEHGSSVQKLQAASQQLEQELATEKATKEKLHRDLSDSTNTLKKEKETAGQIHRELGDVKKVLEEMVAAKTIISIDYDLLNQRLDEYKEMIMEVVNKGLTWIADHSENIRKQVVKFWNKLETEVFPEIGRFVVEDALPFGLSSLKQAKDSWENVYAPHRPTVDRSIKMATTEANSFYTQNLEKHVKTHKIDQHYDTARSHVIHHATMAHEKLVEGITSGSSVAHKLAKTEEYPPFIVKNLKLVNTNAEIVAFCIECLIGFFVVRLLLGMLFKRSKKKKVSQKDKKRQWEQKQAMANKGKKQQHNNNKNGKAKNGTKNGKKNK